MITVLTEKFDVVEGPGYLFRSVKTFLYRIKTQGFSYLTSHFKKKSYTGHYAVTRSLCEGLRKAGIRYNYNPRYSFRVQSHVIVLSGIEVLKEVIALKKKGQVKKIFAGPNLMVRSHEYDQLLADPAIDRVIVPSDWVKTAYEQDLPAIAGRIMVWPAGIDADDYKPVSENAEAKSILIYWKQAPAHLLSQTEDLAAKFGYTARILRYGTYNKEVFMEMLAQSKLAVFYSTSESQGLALQEAWSMDVPTLVWQTTETVTINEKHMTEHDAAPYLTPETGLKFKNMEELERILIAFRDNEYQFTPRHYVLGHLTDGKCARKLAQAVLQ